MSVTNEALAQRRKDALPVNLPTRTGIYAQRARNAEIWDVEGNRYIDFIGGIGVLNVGHCHPKVVEAVKNQAENFLHTAFPIAQYESYVALAERLNALVPGSTPKKTAFFNSGAEATENAAKFSRYVTGRPGIIAFQGGFHGRTLLATAMTGKTKPYKVGFGPFPPGIFHAPYPGGKLSAEGALNCLKEIMTTDIAPEDVACIIVEPVQGEGGFIPAPPAFLQGLRALCDEHGIMLVIDEIQTGFGRTGRMFASEHSGVEADFLCVAKSLAAGMPLSGVVAKAELYDAIGPGAIGSTYGGNPVACAAALAVLDVIEEEGLLERADAIGQQFEQRWQELSQGVAKGRVGEVRRLGAMSAIEFSVDGDLARPDAELAGKVLTAARERGLLMLTAGRAAQALRSLVPLTASDEIVSEGLDIFDAAVAASL